MTSDGWSVGVVVPAHDESALLGATLAAVRVATAQVRPAARTHVVVVADACTDATERCAADALAGEPSSLLVTRYASAGAARAAGARLLLARFANEPPQRTWIATTDADTIVPPGWLERQLAAAAAGWGAVVGDVIVDSWAPRLADLSGRLAAHRRAELRAGRRPVHAANLGVSAAALREVGGLPAIALGEDAALLRALEAHDVPVHHDAGLIVRTSARRSGRAPGGFSSLLDHLEAG